MSMPKPVPDRPLTILDILDGALNVARLRPKTVASILAAFVLPSQLLVAWLQRHVLAALAFDDPESFDSFGSPGADFGVYRGSDAGLAVANVVPYLILPMIGVALTYLVLGWHQGVDRSATQCLKFTMKKMPVIIAAFVLCKLVQLIAFVLLIIPGLFATAFLIVVAPVIAAENLGPLAAMKRSYRLTRRRTGAVMGLLVSMAAVSFLLNTALSVLPLLAAFVFGSWGWVGFFAVGIVSTAVLSAFAVGAAVLLYFDLLNRSEGYDLRRQLDAIAARRGV